MKPVSCLLNILMIAVLTLLTVAPIFTASPAEARRAVGACGRRGCAAVGCGPRGCAGAAIGRPPIRRGAVVIQPRRYWRPGGAIAAGAAVGFLAGVAAVSVAGSPPKPGYCWYYTDSSRTSGFWDPCPR